MVTARIYSMGCLNLTPVTLKFINEGYQLKARWEPHDVHPYQSLTLFVEKPEMEALARYLSDATLHSSQMRLLASGCAKDGEKIHLHYWINRLNPAGLYFRLGRIGVNGGEKQAATIRRSAESYGDLLGFLKKVNFEPLAAAAPPAFGL